MQTILERPMAQAKQPQAKDTRARILLVDDHAVVRFGIAQLINRQADLVVRAVDPDVLGEVSHYLPALYFAFNTLGETVSTDFAKLK